jgi:predicted RNase H-like nuclease
MGKQRNDSDSKVRLEKDNYWKDRVDLLLYEKKNWMKEKKKFHTEISTLKYRVDMMEQRNKHLHDVINRFGNYDKEEFEFDEGTPRRMASNSRKESEDP